MKKYKVLSGDFEFEARVYTHIGDVEDVTLMEWAEDGKPYMFTSLVSYTSPRGAQYKGLYDHAYGHTAIVKMGEEGGMILIAHGKADTLLCYDDVSLALISTDDDLNFYVKSEDY